MKIDEITEGLVYMRDTLPLTRAQKDHLAESANRLQHMKSAWRELFAEFHDGGEINGDGFVDLSSEQIERFIALTL